MKKTLKSISMLAAALVALAAVSCTKEETPSAEQENGISTITLSIEQPADEDATKTALGDKSGDFYPVNWSADDAIAVSAQSGSTFVKYTLSTGASSTTGSFTTSETAPSGAVYAYYPYSQVKSVDASNYTVELPTQQTYVENSFGNGALPMFAVADAAGSLQSMKPLMSVLKLSLKGTCKVNRIVVSHASEKLSGPATVTFSGSDASLAVTGTGTYDFVELLCSDVQLNTSTAKLFYIVVPASSAASTYTVRIVTKESKVLTKTLTTSTKFTAAKIKNANELTGIAPTEVKYVSGSYCGDGITVAGYIWAPVNCGYDANHTYGLLYQWGRKYGQGYDGESPAVVKTAFTSTYISHVDQDNTNKDKFYYNSSYKIWYGGSEPNKLWDTTGGSTVSHTPTKSSYDPCPTGWRVPTYTELNALIGNNGTTSIGSSGWDETGYWFDGTTSPSSGTGLFLPAAGDRFFSSAEAMNRGPRGYYWCSSPHSSWSNYAESLYFGFSDAKKTSFDATKIIDSFRAFGFSVRCIKE